MKLNPGKCAFGVTVGKFLGFMASQRGIEANPDKIRTIIEMAPPRNMIEVQSLNDKVTALNRFVSKATDKCLLFFHMLKKSFEWTTECQQAFEDLKTYLSSLLLLSPSHLREELFLYLAVSLAVVSADRIHSLEGDRIECMVRLDFPTTNNEVEYKALIVGLDPARVVGVENLVVYWDSQVVTNQVNEDYNCKNVLMKKYLEQVKDPVNNLRVKFV